MARGEPAGEGPAPAGSGDGDDDEWKFWLLAGVILAVILAVALLGPAAGGPGTQLGATPPLVQESHQRSRLP